MRKTLLLIFSVMLLFSGCESPENRVTRQSFAFDTVVNITVDKDDFKYTEDAIKLCNEYELVFSRTKKDSELYKINNANKTDLSEDMKKVLEFSKEFSKQSGGTFDVTVEPLVTLWNINSRKVPPTEKEVHEVLKSVGHEKLTLSPFSTGGTTLDLGAVAKGYIADNLAEFFKEKSVDNVIIDLGGNVAVIGEYTVGIRDPFSPDEVFATIRLKDKSAVTSGAYQRYFEYEGKRYHHIIDPRTGYPAESSVASVTVISPSSMQADALSTAIFIFGEKGLSLCDEFPYTDALIITNNKEVITTDDFEKKYNLLIE